MKTATLIATDPLFAATLQAAAAQVDLLLVAKSAGTDNANGITGPLLMQADQALQCHPDGLASTPLALPLPVRLGAVLDWLTGQQRRGKVYALGPHGTLDMQTRRLVRPDGTVVPLTEKEAGMIACLTQAAAPVPRDELLARVWGYSPETDTHTLETHIYTLRQKLEGAGISALLLNGDAGYRLSIQAT